MTKILLFLSVMMLLMTGCSKTFQGIKQDSTNAWDGAKGAVHDATGP